MRQDGGDWIAAAMEVAKGASPIASMITEDLEQRLRGAISVRELTKAEQIQVAKCLIALVRNPVAASTESED